MATESALEEAFRQRIMAVLADRASRNGGLVSRSELSAFLVDGQPYRLVDQSRGIWNPQWLDATLSIVSSPDSRYEDTEVEGGLLRYDYRAGTNQGDNRKLRRALETGVPLILLRKIRNGVYVPVFPVYVVADDTEHRQFLIALDEAVRFLADPLHMTDDQRRYAERVAKVRLHQPVFRGMVIEAYRRMCTICGLRHAELLDAAHIVPDGQPLGQPVVPNGLSLCKIHHAAYDLQVLGVDPDFNVHLSQKLLDEIDGPMLRHGLQEMHGRTLILPTRRPDRPDRDRLALRFAAFEQAI